MDGEAVACDDSGVSSFERIRHRGHDDCVFLYAFDLIELNGDDLRRDPLVVHKATLTSVLAKAVPGIRFNEHMEFDDGETVFRHACRLGLKALFRSGRNRPIIRAGLRTGSR
jgi:bifunctional non-homologous end joining protein LigD